MSWKGYRSGHMMYLRKQDLETANDDIRAFQKSRAQNWGTSKVLTVITRSINNLFNSLMR
jgi:hypothetical protein